MTLALLTRRRISLQRAMTTAGATGEIVRTWQTVLTDIPASVMTFRPRSWKGIERRSIDITYVIMTPQNTGAQFGDRIFDGELYYRVRFTINLGDRDQAWAIYADLLEPQDSITQS